MFTFIKRVISFGWKNFFYNPGLSLATLFVLTLVILLISSIFLFKGVVDHLISLVQEKADISVFFKEDLPETEILKVKEKLSNYPGVKKIEYVSKKEAKEKFKRKHKDDKELMESLEILGNPFLAHLNITLSNFEQYQKLVSFLNSHFGDLIDEVDFSEREKIIQQIFITTENIKKAGIIISVILSFIAILITFTTIKLTIFNFKEEIKIQRLVGASNWFIRGPYLVQGFLEGFFAGLISFSITTTFLYFLTPKLEYFLGGFNLFNYFLLNLGKILLIQFGIGIALAVISSYIAIKKYLEV